MYFRSVTCIYGSSSASNFESLEPHPRFRDESSGVRVEEVLRGVVNASGTCIKIPKRLIFYFTAILILDTAVLHQVCNTN